MKRKFKNWIRLAGIRALKASVQAVAAAVGSTAMFGRVRWLTVLPAALLAGLLSLLTSATELSESEEK